MLRRLTWLLLLLLLAPLPGLGRKKKGAPLAKLPDQTAEIAQPWLPLAPQKCVNWSWAAGLEAMLHVQHVPLTQNYWVLKVNLGEVCDDRPVTPEALAPYIDGDYALEDGRKVRLQSTVIPGAPTIPDQVIAPLRLGQPVLLFWKGRAFLLYGAVFDEYIYPNGQRMFEVRELKLLDPLAAGKQRQVSFVNGSDDPSQLGGALLVTATFPSQIPWQR